VRPKTLDHVALWLADRDSAADVCTSRLGMHVIERTDRFTLLGADARRGKLTLFDADGPREQGALKRIGLRVSSGGGETVDLGEGVEVVLVEAPTDSEYDLDHVALYARDPEGAAREFERYGFAPASPNGAPRVEVGGAYVELHPGDPGEPERPLLNHIAVLVDSVDDHVEEARKLDIEIDDIVDAPNTVAVFLYGPERVRIEYVEHKPGFALK
jgi:catechol 2,3-dioxygenase-like lactoylglutathione lyase family enzyme